MKYKIVAALALVAFVIGCARVPITNRKQLKLLPEDELIAMADTAYREFLAANRVLPASDPRVVQVNRVGHNIARSVETFLAKKNASDRIKGFKWEFNVVDDPTVNAWCMPGGKVVVYTGILPLASNDTLLAVIMGHEIAHAVARHGNERMSQQLAVQGMGQTLGGVLGDAKGKNVFLQSYGIASTLGVLKYSRTHETESDKMGLVFMYLSGYNPARAIDFWEKMAADGGSGPEFLSTHPADDTRIRDIQNFLKNIQKYAN